jgi:proteic killer suppression protein
VRVEFRTNKLERCFTNHRMAVREWGPQVGRTYVKAIEALKAADTAEVIFTLAQFHFHPLREDRAGQHSMDLALRHRLILTLSQQGSDVVAFIEEVETEHYE